jgi:hypothetical protein
MQLVSLRMMLREVAEKYGAFRAGNQAFRDHARRIAHFEAGHRRRHGN